MSVPVTFTISSIKRAKRKTPVNEYSDATDPNPMWRVNLRSSWIPDRYLSLWFEDEAHARKTPKGVVSVSELFGLLEPFDVKYTVGSITQDKDIIGINQYTDKPNWQDTWTVGMNAAGPMGGAGPMPFIDMMFPVQAEAGMFAPGQAYGPLDFLRVFKIFVVFFPVLPYGPPGDQITYYVSRDFTQGFFDANGYHAPGIYPASAESNKPIFVAGSPFGGETSWYAVAGTVKLLEPIAYYIGQNGFVLIEPQ
jgi:hypothetical protein